MSLRVCHPCATLFATGGHLNPSAIPLNGKSRIMSKKIFKKITYPDGTTINEDKTQRKNVTQYRIQYRDASGNRKRAFRPTPEKAQEFAAKRSREVNAYGTSIADLPREDQMNIGVLGKLSRQMGCTLGDMVKLLEEKVSGTQLKDNLLVSELYYDFLQSISGLRPSSRASLENTLSQFYGFQDQPVQDVTHDSVLKFLNCKDWATNTKRLRRNQLHRFFNWAKREGYRNDNPVTEIVNKEEFGAYKKRDDIPVLFPDEVRKIFEVCRKHDPLLLPYFTLGIFCGVRPQELNHVHWRHEFPEKQWKNLPSNVCLEANAVYIQRAGSKTSEKREIPLQPNAQAWLALGGDLPGTRNIRRRRGEIKLLADVTWGKEEADIMRHTFASCHLKNFRHETDLKSAMGHSINSMTLWNHYIGSAITPPMAEEFWNIFP